MTKNILIIEPFFSGSHASWAKQYKKYSSHNIKILSMKGQFWKWRMYGGAVTLAEEFMSLDFDPDIILATDMIDLTTFISLIRKKIKPSVSIAVYFHENQLTYPWKANSKDKELQRDINFGFMNYTTALASDHVFFNSHYNMNSFYIALENLLKKMPDYKHTGIIDYLYKKSEVLPIGINLKIIDEGDKKVYTEDLPLILWNHRWEFDKNPEDFFNALFILKKEGLRFKVAILGESYKNSPAIFNEAFKILDAEIIKSGCLSGHNYLSWLLASDILPVTSNHDFFGISVMEAVYSGSYPILPKRLTYPDLYNLDENPEIFYENFNELVDKLRYAIINISVIRKKSYKKLASPYDWTNLINRYDETIGSLKAN
ncbi:MAG: tRNA-queuosine alpha-mannosyltransferase domain-containing protein [Eubacteriaceae bacterium]